MAKRLPEHSIVSLHPNRVVCLCGWERMNDLNLAMPHGMRMTNSACYDHMLDLFLDHSRGKKPG